MVSPWVAVLTSFHNTPIFGRIWVTVAAVTGYATLVVLLDRFVLPHVETVRPEFHGFLGLILGTLLVFRTNTSYDRWWEGRKLWGQLVNDCRNLAIKVQTCVRADPEQKQRLGRWLCDFAWALKGHLRGGVHLTDLGGFKTDTSHPQHVPAYVSARIYDQFEVWRQNDQLGGFELLFLDQHASSLMNICGACERIQKSPISISYRWFIRQSIAIYLLTLPWGLVETFGWWDIPATAMLGYFMIGVEIIAEEIEDPFGTSADDLRLEDMCQTIERSVMSILREEKLAPEMLPPPRPDVSQWEHVDSANMPGALPGDGDVSAPRPAGN
ncbi:MAG TPA: bestrophin family ion channel [Pirellulaceae bacterium]|nr:bestrophin family ion channel [Pirellulaceae bacterium]